MEDRSKDSHEKLIKSLPIWRGTLELSELSGGITNSNYLVSDGRRRYVVRILGEQPLLGIDRENEVLCMKAGHQCGVCPEIVYSEPGIMVTDFIDGKVLEPEDVRSDEYMERIVTVLKAVHSAGPSLTGEMLYFWPFQVARTYAQRAKDLGAKFPPGIDEALKDVQTIEQEVGAFVPTLCHNDVLSANWIFDGSKMWLVDWEYAGINSPMSDLGNLCANSQFTPDMEERLLERYFGEVTDANLRDLRIMRTISCLRETLWALVQTAISDLDFDYHKYAADNLDLYHTARQELGKLSR